MKTCPDCNGEGVIEKGTDDEQQCPTCGGSGFVPNDDDDHEEVIRTSGYARSPRFIQLMADTAPTTITRIVNETGMARSERFLPSSQPSLGNW